MPLGTRHVARDECQCVARNLHTIAPWPLEVGVGDSLRRSEEIVNKSRIAPFNAIIIIMTILTCRAASE